MRKQFYISSKIKKLSKPILGPDLRGLITDTTTAYIEKMCGIYLAQIININLGLEFDQEGYIIFGRRCSSLFNSLQVSDFEIIYNETVWSPLDEAPRDKIKIQYRISNSSRVHQLSFSISEIKNEYHL